MTPCEAEAGLTQTHRPSIKIKFGSSMTNIFCLCCILFNQRFSSIQLHVTWNEIQNLKFGVWMCSRSPWHHYRCAAVFYIWTANLSPLLSHTHARTHARSRGYRKRLQADSLCHQEPNGDDANGYDLIRQAPPPVKTCEMCPVINTFSTHRCVLFTCGAMGMEEILNIKHTLNMAITHLNCCFQPMSEAETSSPAPTCTINYCL